MNAFLDLILKLSRWAQGIAGVALTGIMGLTVTDVMLRSLGRPIVGSYEIVALMGAVVIGFPFPLLRGFGDISLSISSSRSSPAIHERGFTSPPESSGWCSFI